MINKYYNKIKENGIVNCINYFVMQLKKKYQLKKIKKIFQIQKK